MIFKSDKLDYLRCPRKEKIFDNFFSIEQGPSNVGKLNWDLLGFFSFIFSLTWGDTAWMAKSADFNLADSSTFWPIPLNSEGICRIGQRAILCCEWIKNMQNPHF